MYLRNCQSSLIDIMTTSLNCPPIKQLESGSVKTAGKENNNNAKQIFALMNKLFSDVVVA